MDIGTDILYIPKLKKIIEKYPSFIKKVYTKKELELASTYKDPIFFYATRFAAKEAIIKATDGLFDFAEIEVLRTKSGKPLAKIVGRNNITIDISLSFDNEYAICFCAIKK